MSNQVVLNYLSTKSVPKLSTVIFDDVEYITNNFEYNSQTGAIIFKRLGKYRLNWQMNTSVKVVDIMFNLYSNTPDYEIYLEDIKLAPQSGSVIVDVPYIGFTLKLINQETFNVNFNQRVKKKGTLTISNYINSCPCPTPYPCPHPIPIPHPHPCPCPYSGCCPCKGEKGDPGDTPEIGENGNWFIGGVDTGVSATGDPGLTPEIGANGHWFIGGVDTGISAIGEQGPRGEVGPPGPAGSAYVKYYHAACTNRAGANLDSGDAIPFNLIVSNNMGDEVTFDGDSFQFTGPAIYKVDWQVSYSKDNADQSFGIRVYYNNTFQMSSYNQNNIGQVCGTHIIEAESDIGVFRLDLLSVPCTLINAPVQATILITKWETT